MSHEKTIPLMSGDLVWFLVLATEVTRPGVDKVKPKGWFRYSLRID